MGGSTRAQMTLLAAALAVMLALPSTATAAWWAGASQPVGADAAPRMNAAIDGANLVCEGTSGQVPNVWLYDLDFATSRAIAPSANTQRNPQISGVYAAWEEYRVGDWDVCVKNLQTGQSRYTATTGDERAVSVSGTTAVYELGYEWKDSLGVKRQGWDVYAWDLLANAQFRVDFLNVSGWQRAPSVCGDTVVYQDNRNGNWDIYCSNLTLKKETRLTTDGADQTVPDISGAKVVYEDRRNGNSDIYLFDLDTRTEKQLTNDPGEQTSPEISGNLVVWQDNRSGLQQVWALDLSSGVSQPIQSQESAQAHPTLSGSRIAWDTSDSSVAQIWERQLSLPVCSMTAPLGVSYASKAAVSGHLKTGAGEPIEGATLALEYSTTGSSWVSYARTETAPDGSYTVYTPALAAGRYVRVKFAGGADYLDAVSQSALIRPQVSVTTPAALRTVYRNTSHPVTGYLKPRHKAGTYPLKLQCYRKERQRNGTYAWVLRKTVLALASNYSSYSAYRASLSLPLSGAWRIRAYHAPDSQNLGTYSGWRYVTVR